MQEDDIWEMSAVPQHLWNLNRPRTLAMYKVRLTYNQTHQNINVTHTTNNQRNKDNSSEEDVRQSNAQFYAQVYDQNNTIQAAEKHHTPPEQKYMT